MKNERRSEDDIGQWLACPRVDRPSINKSSTRCQGRLENQAAKIPNKKSTKSVAHIGENNRSPQRVASPAARVSNVYQREFDSSGN